MYFNDSRLHVNGFHICHVVFFTCRRVCSTNTLLSEQLGKKVFSGQTFQFYQAALSERKLVPNDIMTTHHGLV